MKDFENSSFLLAFNKAKQGDGTALGKLLQDYRPWMKLLAKRVLKGELAGRIDESDLVQQTCLSVHKNIKDFKGDQPGEFIAWIKQIHERNVQNNIRDHQQVQMRSVEKERRFETESDLNAMTEGAKITSPSQRALKGEQAIELAIALENLPPDQAEAIRLRYLEGYSLAEVTKEMDRSFSATVGLIKRGMLGLKKQFPQD